MTELIVEPIISMAETITAPEIADDLAARIIAELRKSCYMRETDCYASYAAKIKIELQLVDIDTENIDSGFTVGAHDGAKPSRPFRVSVEQTSPREIRERNNLRMPESLERTVDGSAPEVPPKRFYAPRQSKNPSA